jgi:hypothetical protein
MVRSMMFRWTGFDTREGWQQLLGVDVSDKTSHLHSRRIRTNIQAYFAVRQLSHARCGTCAVSRRPRLLPVQRPRKSVNKVRLVLRFLVDWKSPAAHQQTRFFIASSCYVCYHKFSYFKIYVQYTDELAVGKNYGVAPIWIRKYKKMHKGCRYSPPSSLY